jgi:2-oxoglutarate ferredoxin oxidoreductase subunit delta
LNVNKRDKKVEQKEGLKKSKDLSMPEDPAQTRSRKAYEQVIFRDWCKACGICSAFCPKNVIGRDEAGLPVVERPEECIACRFCEIHCPDFAITIREKLESTKEEDL